jgi:carbonic anhydrase
MLTPEKAIEKLIEGNKRFVDSVPTHPNIGAELRNSLVNGQRPFAAVLSCSDSRVPVEIIFDVGIGDLFVVRTAGQVLSKEVIGSLEYAVSALGAKLVLILGHDNCGAVNAAYSYYKGEMDSEFSENLSSVLGHIYPALENLKPEHENVLKEAVRENVNYQVKDLVVKSPYLAKKIEDNEIALVSAMYCLSSGKVEFSHERINPSLLDV